MIEWEKVFKTADELGIKYEKVETDQAGFYVINENGTERRLTLGELDDLFEI